MQDNVELPKLKGSSFAEEIKRKKTLEAVIYNKIWP